MATPPVPPGNANKVVVACLDGRRLKGHVYNFSVGKDRFRLFPEEDSPQHAGTDVELKNLKAIFFVKDFIGNLEYRETSGEKPPRHGRGLEVTFHDGETIVGTTEAYNPQKVGFFMFPADPGDNNIRIFVINKNVRQVRILRGSPGGGGSP